MKFAIGTSQFLKKYGLLKKSTTRKDLIKIIKIYSNKIDLIDTAPSYRNAEKTIGLYKNKKTKIMSKINKILSKNPNKQALEINENINNTLNKLKLKKIFGLLFHHVDDVNLIKNKIIKNKLDLLKKNNLVKKIGFSCYDISKIEKYLKIYNFDIVQFPLNIFTINKKKINILKKIKKKYKIEFHSRSIFLQGLALAPNLKIPKKFNLLKNKISEIDKICLKKKISKHNFFISSIASLKIIDYAIIGLSNYDEYKLIKNFKKKIINKNFLNNFEIKDKKIIDPRNWKINQ